MSKVDINKKALDFKNSADRVFSTSDGIKVLAYLKEEYVDRSSLRDSEYSTYYSLGQKELVQSLIQFIKEDINFDTYVVSDSNVNDY